MGKIKENVVDKLCNVNSRNMVEGCFSHLFFLCISLINLCWKTGKYLISANSFTSPINQLGANLCSQVAYSIFILSDLIKHLAIAWPFFQVLFALFHTRLPKQSLVYSVSLESAISEFKRNSCGFKQGMDGQHEDRKHLQCYLGNVKMNAGVVCRKCGGMLDRVVPQVRWGFWEGWGVQGQGCKTSTKHHTHLAKGLPLHSPPLPSSPPRTCFPGPHFLTGCLVWVTGCRLPVYWEGTDSEVKARHPVECREEGWWCYTNT